MDPLHVIVPRALPEVREELATALAVQGFGILTEIDLQATFRSKLDVAHEGHRVLGVCNPMIAKRALDLDRDVALLLPCTVTLRETDPGTEVRALDPELAFGLAAPATQAALAPLAAEVSGRLAAALAALGTAHDAAG